MSAETREKVDAALRAHAADEWDNDYIVDWIVVAGLLGPDAENSIGIETSRENQPAYISTGLLREALDIGAERDCE